MTGTQRFSDDEVRAYQDAYQREGFVRVPGLLSAEEVAAGNAAIDRLLEARERDGVQGGGYAVVKHYPELMRLVEHEGAQRLLVNLLHENLQATAVHVGIVQPDSDSGTWHQDGPSRREGIKVDGVYPNLGIKIGYIFSDASQPGRGNTMVVPGSHRRIENPCAAGTSSDEPVPGAIEVTGDPGDAFIFGFNLWHTPSRNRSAIQRRQLFIAYNYAWMMQLDPLHREAENAEHWARLSDVGKQLRGGHYLRGPQAYRCSDEPPCERFKIPAVELWR